MEILMNENNYRIRCSDEQFLEAVFTSKTYSEISEKTGQKISTTAARYKKAKKALAEKGIEIPSIERKRPKKNINDIENMIKIVKRLKSLYENS